jgi:3-hydroxybutyryl-CoA dehydrogenase
MSKDSIQNVCVVGGGTMGRQIALNAAINGYKTTLTDTMPDILAAVSKWAPEYLEGRVSKGKLNPEQVTAILARFKVVGNLEEAVKDTDLVIEAIVEKLNIKKELFEQLDRFAPPHAILATNSSSFVSSSLADATKRPDRVANLHYFNPALVMEVVEVVQGAHTSQETAEKLIKFVESLKKTPIWLKKEIDSFVVNRILGAIYREAMFLVENGYASPREVDIGSEKGLGHPMGPFKLMDLVGLDVAYLIRKERFDYTGLEEHRPPKILEEKYLKGELGKKTGKGWYEYN